MRKFWNRFLFVIAMVLVPINVVNAASKCDYNEQAKLNNDVADIKITYEEAEGSTGEILELEGGGNFEETYNYFKITIYNLTESFFVRISNDYNNEVKYIRYSDLIDGVGIYEWSHLEKVTKFTFKIYSSNETGCANEEYRIVYLTTPRLNTFYNNALCTGKESFYLCQKYVTEEEVDYTTFMSEVNSFSPDEKEDDSQGTVNDDKTFFDNIREFVSENKLTIGIVSTIIVIGGGVAIVIVIKKRRSRLI